MAIEIVDLPIVIVNSYVKLPEGKSWLYQLNIITKLVGIL